MCDPLRLRSITARIPPFRRLLAVLLVVPLVMAGRAAAQPAGRRARQVLHLTSGKTSTGEIRPSNRPGVLRWQADPSGSPSDVAWNEVDAIEWPPPTTRSKPAGDFRFELAAGDVLFGAAGA